ncbi:hypothetical protein [Planctomycetes bacterium CA13]|uniref:hypothetical protein n=1 Tax=Novipirellula herctigrandis TaxID=2527986 RepID=UPI0011B676ED
MFNLTRKKKKERKKERATHFLLGKSLSRVFASDMFPLWTRSEWEPSLPASAHASLQHRPRSTQRERKGEGGHFSHFPIFRIAPVKGMIDAACFIGTFDSWHTISWLKKD